MGKKVAVVLGLIVFLGACNRPLGNHRLAKVDKDNYLTGPWESRTASSDDLKAAESQIAKLKTAIDAAKTKIDRQWDLLKTSSPDRTRLPSWLDAKTKEANNFARKLLEPKKLLSSRGSSDEDEKKRRDSIDTLNKIYKENALSQQKLELISKLSKALDSLKAAKDKEDKLRAATPPDASKITTAEAETKKKKKELEALKAIDENQLKAQLPDIEFFEAELETTYTIQFDNAFFKYLQDAGNSSEVLIVLSFEEVGSKDSEIVKVFGPIDLVPDSTLSRSISRVTYGPKPLKGSYTKVKIQVIEYDVGEREKRESFLNFVSELSSSVAIADPATAAEIKLAAEIAKFVNSLDKNDLILDFRFDLIPPMKGESKPLGIPLDNGQYVLIKQEHEGFLSSSFFGISKKVHKTRSNYAKPFLWLFTVPFDIAFAPFTVSASLFSDEPDANSLTDLKYRKNGTHFVYEDDDKPLMFDKNRREIYLGERKKTSENNDTKTDEVRETYDYKTWVAFSIEMGRDAKLWDAKQEALRTQKLVDKFLKDGDQASIEGAKNALEGLLSTLKEEKSKKKLKGEGKTIQALIDNVDAKLNADPAPSEDEKKKLEATKETLEKLLKESKEKAEEK